MNEIVSYNSATADSIPSLGTVVPAQLAEEMNEAQQRLTEALGGDVVGYVANRLHLTEEELSTMLAAEQVDGVALAIYNIEARGQSVIIGDQTGIGKGRQAAAMIRYGINAGYFPIFLTDRYTLFSDMYRDCKALGIADARPLIVNSKVAIVDFDRPISSTKISQADEVWSSDEDDSDDEDIASLFSLHYDQVYKSPKKKEMDAIYELGDIPDERYDYMMITYSQLKDARRDRTRVEFLMSVCRKRKVLFVFDEAHRSSSVSDGKVSMITQCINDILETSAQTQCVFLSATFAKRPESLLTFMQQTMLNSLASSDTLQKAFANGGVPMQEYVAARLAREGQMIRREHSGRGIPDPVYTYLDSQLTRHSELFDGAMQWFRQMVDLADLIKDYVKAAKELDIETFRPYPVRQQLFYVNKILLLALKAADVAEAAVGEVKAGRSVVIGMSDTLECVLRDSVDPVTGACSRGDFSTIMLRLLDKTLSNPHDPQVTIFDLDLSSLRRPETLLAKLDDIRRLAASIEQGIRNTVFHLPMSPIDVIRQLIEKHKIRFEECTGRARQLQYDSPEGCDDFVGAKIIPRKKRHTSHIYNDFQNNKLDVILVNATGAIGASAHATVTAEVPEGKVRQRKMLIVQNDLDVNIDLQKRGRINRTGQLASLPPLYEYIITAIPSEKRLNMMLRAKLRSLSANTTANQNQEQSQADFIDITNKYGNMVAQEFLTENPKIATTLGLTKKSTASQLLARTAMLSVADQQEIIDDLFASYQNLELELKRINQWDLEREHRDFEAEFESEQLFSMAIDNEALGGASMLTTFRCRHRTFPYDAASLQKAVKEAQAPYGANLGQSKQLRLEMEDYFLQEIAKAKEKSKAQALVHFKRMIDTLCEKGVDRSAAIDTVNAVVGTSARITQKQMREYLHNHPEWKVLSKQLEELREEIFKVDLSLDRALQNIYNQRRQLFTVIEHTVIGQAYQDISYAVPVGNKYPRVYGVLKEVRFGKKPSQRFAPTKVQYVFALSAEHKEIALNISSRGTYSNFSRVHSLLVYGARWKFSPKVWNAEIAKYNNRVLPRKIITGNILGAFANPLIAEMQPRFITFTLAPDANGNKAIERGLLLPMSGINVEKVSENVTLPLAEGLKFANENYHFYPISGSGVDFTISPQRSGQDKMLCYHVSVAENDAPTFELDRHFDPIRNLFRREKRNRSLRFVTDLLAFNSPRFLQIMEFLASRRAMIVVPRTHLTVGQLREFTGKRKAIDNSNWPMLDWHNPHNPQNPLRPGAASEPIVIRQPDCEDPDVKYVDKLPKGVELSRRTLRLQDKSLADTDVAADLRNLFFEWNTYASDVSVLGDFDWIMVARSTTTDLQRILKSAAANPTVRFSEVTLSMLTSRITKIRLSPVGQILQRFQTEMLLLSPPKAQVQEFLDGCFYDPKLDKIRSSLQDYLDGKTSVIS